MNAYYMIQYDSDYTLCRPCPCGTISLLSVASKCNYDRIATPYKRAFIYLVRTLQLSADMLTYLFSLFRSVATRESPVQMLKQP